MVPCLSVFLVFLPLLFSLRLCSNYWGGCMVSSLVPLNFKIDRCVHSWFISSLEEYFSLYICSCVSFSAPHLILIPFLIKLCSGLVLMLTTYSFLASMLTSLLIPISMATLFIPFEVLLALGSANMLLVIVVEFKYWARLWSVRLEDFKCLDISVWRIFRISIFVLLGREATFF